MQIAFSPTPSPSPAAAAAGAPAAAGRTSSAFGDVFQQLIGEWTGAVEAPPGEGLDVTGAPRRPRAGDDAAVEPDAPEDDTPADDALPYLVAVDAPPTLPVTPPWGLPDSGSLDAVTMAAPGSAEPPASLDPAAAWAPAQPITTSAAHAPDPAAGTAIAPPPAATGTAPVGGERADAATQPAAADVLAALTAADTKAPAPAATETPTAPQQTSASAPPAAASAAGETRATAARAGAPAAASPLAAAIASLTDDATPGPRALSAAPGTAHDADTTRDEATRDGSAAPLPGASVHHALQRIGAQLSVAPDLTVGGPAPSPPPTGPAMAAHAAAAPDHVVAPQIVQAMRLLAVDGGGEARVLLKPEYLGEVVVVVKVTDGGVTAAVHADSPAVRQWAETHEASLRQALGTQGLRLDQLTVTPDVRDAAPSERQAGEGSADTQQRQPSRQRRPRRDADHDAERFEVVL